jgi:hypothetical protein
MPHLYLEYLAYGIVLLASVYALPLMVYLCVKMGTLGYLKARERFSTERYNKEEKQ